MEQLEGQQAMETSLVSRIGPFQKRPHTLFRWLLSHEVIMRWWLWESRLSPDSVISNWSPCFQSWEKLVSVYTPPALWHRCCSNPNWLQQIVSEVKIQALEMKPGCFSVSFPRGVSTQVRVEPINGRWKWWSQCFFKSPGSGKTPSRGMGEVHKYGS